jgi:hypothetical protein
VAICNKTDVIRSGIFISEIMKNIRLGALSKVFRGYIDGF